MTKETYAEMKEKLQFLKDKLFDAAHNNNTNVSFSDYRDMQKELMALEKELATAAPKIVTLGSNVTIKEYATSGTNKVHSFVLLANPPSDTTIKYCTVLTELGGAILNSEIGEIIKLQNDPSIERIEILDIK